MRDNAIFTILAVVMVLSSCKTVKGPSGLNIYSEPDDPDFYDLSVWDNAGNGLNASFASSNYSFSKSIPPSEGLTSNTPLYGWRGDRINAQAVLWSNEAVENIHLKTYVSGMKEISQTVKPEINTFIVHYLLCDEFLNGCGWRDKDTLPSHITPDILFPGDSLSLVAKETRPVWLTIDIPANMQAGEYDFRLEIITPADTILKSTKLQVIDRLLPEPSEWNFHLDLWQNPWAVARYHDVQPWSQEHWDLLRPLLQKLASSGQKCITTTLNDMPWGAQTYDPFGSMINWIKDNNGNWVYDYSLFDQYVNFAMDCGIRKQINCYSMVPWNNRFIYYSEDSTSFVEVKAVPGSDEYNELWKPFLRDFREHLADMGWLDITAIAMDERKREDMNKIITLIEDEAPELKITLAGDLMEEEIDKYVYDLSVTMSTNPSREEVTNRVKKGKPTTFYTYCGRPENPNNFTFSPPADNTYIGWFAAGWGYSGFLRWAYNSWVENPFLDSRFRTWPSGDTYLVYPYAISSVRFEKLSEGIRDYEKIKILQDELSTDPTPKASTLEIELNEFLSSLHFSQLDSIPSATIIEQGQDLLYRIATR